MNAEKGLVRALDTAISWLPSHEVKEGCTFPKPGRSIYENKCSCGLQKKISRLLTTDECICYACPVCDPGFLD